MRPWLLSTLVVLAPLPALAQAPASPQRTTTTPSTPPVGATPTTTSTGRGPSPYQAALNQGTDAYRRRDYTTAVTAFQQASALDRAAALPMLYIGYAQLARGDAATALGSFREAQRLATVGADDAMRARAMAALAATLESQLHWDEARVTWQDYATWGDSHAGVSFPATARARVEALQRRTTVTQAAEPVRQRIAERLRRNAAAQPTPEGMAPAAPGAVPGTPPTR
ncbi:MAG: hypothetical protein HY909_14950 [Deltaproteobacteria bacterium]|nr:hypothetical protein [Deltaproteobacteria bacterium]